MGHVDTMSEGYSSQPGRTSNGQRWNNINKQNKEHKNMYFYIYEINKII